MYDTHAAHVGILKLTTSSKRAQQRNEKRDKLIKSTQKGNRDREGISGVDKSPIAYTKNGNERTVFLFQSIVRSSIPDQSVILSTS